MMFLAWLGAAFAQDIPAGATIPEAAVVNIPPEGLDQLGGLVSGFLPVEGIELDPINQSGGGGFCLLEYNIDLSNMKIGLAITDTSVVPEPGVLNVTIDALININDPADKFQLYLDAICITNDCPGYVAPFPVTITLPIALDIVTDPVTGDAVLDATLGDMVLDNGLQDSDINLDCGIQTLQNVLDLVGISIYDYLIGFAEDFLVQEIEAQTAQIEATIEDAFASATINQSFEVLPGATLDVYLAPSDVLIDTDGMALIMEAAVDAPLAPCLQGIDPGASKGTSGPAPSLASEPAGTQMAVQLSDDFVNQTLYGVWRSGLLCQEIAGGEFGGFAVDTNLLGLLGGAPYQELFPDTAPMIIKTIPHNPLEADFSGSSDIQIPIEDLEVLFFAELDGRMARALSVGISPDVNVDLVFDDTVGELAVDIALGDDFRTELTGDVMIPGAEAEIVDNVDGALVGLVDSLLGSLLGDAISFGLPALDGGFGLTSLSATPTGGGEWLGLYAEVGTVTYPAGSCSDGCSGGSGCTSSGSSAFTFAALMVFFMRRRR